MRLNERAREALEAKLASLRTRHRELDEKIDAMSAGGAFDQLEVQRLKKQKLGLKDEIVQVEGKLLPDIIA